MRNPKAKEAESSRLLIAVSRCFVLVTLTFFRLCFAFFFVFRPFTSCIHQHSASLSLAHSLTDSRQSFGEQVFVPAYCNARAENEERAIDEKKAYKKQIF